MQARKLGSKVYRASQNSGMRVSKAVSRAAHAPPPGVQCTVGGTALLRRAGTSGCGPRDESVFCGVIGEVFLKR